ncbi:MAG: sigma-70 family RNA polymerase sigma factor [Saprospiraceae bacterium]|nr:sigma-70 family RNA polymerase sigma factor [Saprospiraceae bacterium]
MKDYMSDTQMIQAIQSGDSEGIKQLYHQYFKMIADLVINNSGSKEDAEDIFQETLVAFITKARGTDFKLTSNLSSYLYAISNNMWLYRLGRSKNGPFVLKETMEVADMEDTIPEIMVFEEKHALIAKLFDKISVECQKILSGFYFDGKALKDIGHQMNYTEGSIRVKKSRCMDGLKKLVEEHPDYLQLIEK